MGPLGVVPGPGTKESQKKPRVSLSLTGVFFFFRCLLTFCGLFVMKTGITD